MADPALGDLLAGTAGHGIDRQGLNAFVANSQALNGLRSAQTEDALLNAQRMREEQDASDQLESSYMSLKKPDGSPMYAPSDAHWLATQQKFMHGSAKDALAAQKQQQENGVFATVADPNADPNARLAGIQALSQKPESGFSNVGQQLVGNVGPTAATNPTVIQTPGSTAAQNAANAIGNLHQAQADVGGFNPHQAGVTNLPPEQQAAIQKAVDEGRLNFKDLNSRTTPIIAQLAVGNPTYNFNRAAADAALSRNSTFQQRSMVVDSLPGLISHVTSLGSNLKYPDTQVLGQIQQWLQGQQNDPDLAEYMAARNDALFKITNVMRGVGMSDKAQAAEDEIMHPTMSPAALNGWMKGQMSSITPLMEQQRRASHIGEQPPAPVVTPAPNSGTGGPQAAPAGPQFVEGQTATNKATGQKLVFKGGQWQPL
jgi:hypothetical protein